MMKETDSRVWEELVYARKDRGLKRTELAAKLGVPVSSVCSWEEGRLMPDMAMSLRMLDVLEVSECFLFPDGVFPAPGTESRSLFSLSDAFWDLVGFYSSVFHLLETVNCSLRRHGPCCDPLREVVEHTRDLLVHCFCCCFWQYRSEVPSSARSVKGDQANGKQ